MSNPEYLDPQATQGPQNRVQPSMDPATGLPALPADMRWHIEPLVLGLNPLTIELQKRCGIVWVEVCELARQIELAHYPQIREWRGNGRPTCAKCGSSWPCRRARDAVRLREILGGGDDPGDDGARDLIPEVTATRAVPKARKPGTAHEAKETA